MLYLGDSLAQLHGGEAGVPGLYALQKAFTVSGGPHLVRVI